MKDLWKILGTTRFITIGYFNPIPKTPRFKFNNRKLFYDHLNKLEGVNTQSDLWLHHLKNVNYYCDTQEVTLLDDEYEAMIGVYNNKTSSNVHAIVNDEESLFKKNAKHFEVDSLDFDLRMYRPKPCFLPDGDIDFKRKT